MPYARIQPRIRDDRQIEYVWMGEVTDKLILDDKLLQLGILERLPWKLIRQNRVCGGWEFIREPNQTSESD